ncbi:MAG: choice-of-anchor I family protein [Pseudomonadota bacterium]
MKQNSIVRGLLFAAIGVTVIACDGDDGRDGIDGATGSPGADGMTSLLLNTTLPEGNSNCAAGGTRIDSGIDDDGNGQLSDDEIDQSSFVCNGTDSGFSTLELTFLGRTPALAENFDESAAEIVAFDPATDFAYLVNANAGQIDIVDLSSPNMPTIIGSLDAASDIALVTESSMGGVNSVAVDGGLIAVAVEANPKQENGYIAFYNTEGTFLRAVEAGALPDMVTFTPNGEFVVAANEGEPSDDYSVDPQGSITIIARNAIEAATVSLADSTRVTGPVRLSSSADVCGGGVTDINTRMACDLEPEFITVSTDSKTAYVALQENNAVAVVDIASASLTNVLGLGFKDYGQSGNGIDASNEDGGANIQNWNVFGTFMPDAIDSYSVAGTTYLLTANEGDGREYLTETEEAECPAGRIFDDGDCIFYLDEIRIGDIADTGATLSSELLASLPANYAEDQNLGRLKVITDLGLEDTGCLDITYQPTASCVYNDLYSFGARSFTIWNASTGAVVYDSGSDFETITFTELGETFNASNDDNEGDDRSDDKGPEPEAVKVENIAGKWFAFIALERVGGVMVYEVTDPSSPSFVQYLNERDFTVDAEDDLELVGDLGPEDIAYIPGSDSPNGEPLLLLSNEVSGTLSVFSISLK